LKARSGVQAKIERRVGFICEGGVELVGLVLKVELLNHLRTRRELGQGGEGDCDGGTIYRIAALINRGEGLYRCFLVEGEDDGVR